MFNEIFVRGHSPVANRRTAFKEERRLIQSCEKGVSSGACSSRRTRFGNNQPTEGNGNSSILGRSEDTEQVRLKSHDSSPFSQH